MSNEYRVYTFKDSDGLAERLNHDSQDGFMLWEIIPVGGKAIVTTVKYDEKRTEPWDLLIKAAERAYQSDVVDTLMEQQMIGPGNEYADKQDWIDSWMAELRDE